MSNILIVEDDPMVALINRRYLELIGELNVFGPVKTKHEVFNIVEEKDIDLILLDEYLPQDRGMEILKDLRDKQYFNDVIMITAANSQQEVQKAYAYGVIDYLIKPFEFDRFQEAIEKHLKRKNSLEGKSVIKQKDIDQQEKGEIFVELPKGRNKRTLDRIMIFLENNPRKVWTLRELSKEMHISNVTIKKYMDYLEQRGRIEVKLTSGNIGRPEHQYMLREEFTD